MDGRHVDVPNYEKGNFVGPTVLSGVKVYVSCIEELLFHCALEIVFSNFIDLVSYKSLSYAYNIFPLQSDFVDHLILNGAKFSKDSFENRMSTWRENPVLDFH